MFTILFLKIISLNAKTRLMVGFSVLAIIAIALLFACRAFFVADHTASYADSNTVFYLRLDYYAANNAYGQKFKNLMLEQSGLDGLDPAWLGRELAIICDETSGRTDCATLMTAKDYDKLENFLASQNIPHRRLNDHLLAISADADFLSTIKSHHNPFKYFTFAADFGGSKAITLVMRSNASSQSKLGQLLYLAIQPKIKLNGTIKPDQIIFRSSGFVNDEDFTSSSDTPDIIIKTTGKLPLTSRLIATMSEQLGTPAGLPLPDAVIATKKQASGEIIDDYDFALHFSLSSTTENVALVKNNLISAANRLNPQAKTIYLSDGTRVNELMPGKNVDFSTSSEKTTLNISKNRQLYFVFSSSGLIIGNNPAYQPDFSSWPADSYQFNISALPNGTLKSLLSDFSSLRANNNQIELR